MTINEAELIEALEDYNAGEIKIKTHLTKDNRDYVLEVKLELIEDRSEDD